MKIYRWIIPILLLQSVVAGCTIRMVMGSRPNTDVLESSLKVGESSLDQVSTLLGQPYATGRWMTPIDDKPRTVWTYYYENGSLDDARRIMLFVYFDQNKYVGYMWFSSLLD